MLIRDFKGDLIIIQIKDYKYDYLFYKELINKLFDK